MPVALCKQKTSSMDFVKWQVFLEEEVLNGFHREDYFFAQICQYIEAVNTKDGKIPPIKKFLFKFAKEKPESEVIDGEVPDHIRHQMMKSRAIWGAFAGVDIPMDDLLPPEESSDILPFPG